MSSNITVENKVFSNLKKEIYVRENLLSLLLSTRNKQEETFLKTRLQEIAEERKNILQEDSGSILGRKIEGVIKEDGRGEMSPLFFLCKKIYWLSLAIQREEKNKISFLFPIKKIKSVQKIALKTIPLEDF
jgi:hypothetical protein